MTTQAMPTYLQPFPKRITAERPIPVELWPDMKGVRTAKTVVHKPDLKSWQKFWKTAVEFTLVSVDFETSGLTPFHGTRIVGVAVAYYDGKNIQAGYWNFRHTGHKAHRWCQNHEAEKATKHQKTCKACKKDILEGMCPGYKEEYPQLPLTALQDMVPVYKKCIIGGQNFKFDEKHGHVDGLPVPETVLDAMLIAHLWDENKRFYNLASLGKEMGEVKLGDSVKDYMEEHGLKAEGHGHEQVACSVEAPYAIEDTVLVLKRLQFERERWVLLQDPKIMEVFQIENAQSTVVAQMEIDGMKLDLPFVEMGIKQLDEEMAEIEAEIYKDAGKKFDILSTDQLWDILAKRGHKPLRLTPKDHKPSLTDFDLGQYNDTLCELVKTYRSRSKMVGTYFKPFRDTHIDPKGFLHPDFFIHGTVSGRSSCREPNLQNMTKFEKFGTRTRTGSIAQAIREGVKGEEAEYPHLEVRRCFIPRSPNHSLLFADYAQMELRVFAEYADEKFMLQALADGKDIHAETARKVFPNFPDEKTDPKLYGYFRQLAKQISFGILYGMGKNKLAVQLDVPVDETVRLCRMVTVAAAEGFDIKGVTHLTVEQCEKIIEDQKVMTVSRQWSGLKVLERETKMKISPEPLEEFLFGDPERKAKHQRLMYSANVFLGNFHNQFPKIKQFTKGIEKAIGTRGYIFNRYGRRYHLKSDEAYIGINRLVQGSSADMVKIAQWRCHELLKGTQSYLINSVHDELQFDIHHSETHLIEKIRGAMEYFPDMQVKMKVDMDYSHLSWSDKHEWENEEEFKKSLKEFKDGAAAKNTGKSSGARVAKSNPPRTVSKGARKGKPRVPVAR